MATAQSLQGHGQAQARHGPDQMPPRLRRPQAESNGGQSSHRLGHLDECLRQGLAVRPAAFVARSEEHTSELQSLMRISYAVFCLKKTKKQNHVRMQGTPKNITYG